MRNVIRRNTQGTLPREQDADQQPHLKQVNRSGSSTELERESKVNVCKNGPIDMQRHGYGIDTVNNAGGGGGDALESGAAQVHPSAVINPLSGPC